MHASPTATPQFPLLRWVALAWLAVWVPAYWSTWGSENFLLLCDVSVFVACAAIWMGRPLLLSSQAVATLLTGAVWALDVGWRLAAGTHFFGGTEYMFDAGFPLAVRLLSLYHVALPALLLWTLRRTGYDRRGWLLQSGIAGAVLVTSRLVAPERNLNFAFRDPIFDRAWGPAPVHLALILGFLVVLFYWPAHVLLRRLLPPPEKPRPD